MKMGDEEVDATLPQWIAFHVLVAELWFVRLMLRLANAHKYVINKWARSTLDRLERLDRELPPKDNT